MIDVAKESLAAHQENARLTENQYKEGASLVSQRDATQSQAMGAPAPYFEASLDYLLSRDELNRVRRLSQIATLHCRRSCRHGFTNPS